MRAISKQSIYPLFASLMTLTVLAVACGGEAEEQETPEFVVTPAEGGQPQFLNTSTPEAAYPTADEGDGRSVPSESGYPAPPTVQESDLAYPPPTPQHTVDGRAWTAIEAYQLVEAIAKEEFHEDAYLSAVVPSRIMITNLGNPPVLPGWFYRFRRPESRREFIVQVVDDVVVGSTLTESAMDVTPAELPLNLADMQLDSDQVLDMFQSVVVEQGVLEDIVYDLELVDLGSGPTWSVVHPVTREWLFSVSAISGEEVLSPYDR